MTLIHPMKTLTATVLACSIATLAVAQVPVPESAPVDPTAVVAPPSDIPAILPMSRYETMVAKSPFAIATPVVEAPPPDKGFAEGWYVGGLAQMDGKDFVTIKSRDQSVQFSLFGDAPHPENGVSLKSVKWSAVIGQSTVMLEKDGVVAPVEFNQAELQTSTVAAAPQTGALPTPNPNTSRRVPPGSAPTGVIPRPGGPPTNTLQQSRNRAIPQPAMVPQAGPQTGLTPGTTARPGTVPSPSDASRRRIRFINTNPPQP